MSLIHNFVQKVLQFNGTYDEAVLQIQSFIAQIFCSLLNTKQNQELLIFNACLKRIDLVLQNIHEYFKEINPPIKRLFRNKPYNFEGFISSDEEIVPKVEQYSHQKGKQQSKDQVKEKTLPVDEQVQMRDELIKKMTIGYLKDVQHLREMFVRKDLFPNEEIFDVSYYDYTNNLDPIIKQFIYNKILDLTQQFRLQIEKLTQQNSQYLNEIDKLKCLVKKIVGSAEISSQIKAILQIDKDLYRFWRGVQDVIGNEQIFEIFEKRKMGYGIDYYQIDQLINNSQASGRVFQEFKTHLEEQQIKLTEHMGREIMQFRKQIEKLNFQIQDFDELKHSDYTQVKANIKSKIEAVYDIKLNNFMEQQRQNLQDALQLISDKDSQLWIRRCIKGHALYKWIYFAKIKKLLNFPKIKRSLSFDKRNLSINVFGLKDNRVGMIKKQMKEKQNELIEAQMNYFEIQGENNLLKSKYNNIKYNLDMLIQKSVYMKQTLVQQENVIAYFDKIFKLLKNKLGYNYFDINLKNSNFYLEKSNQHLNLFEQRISKLNLEDQNLLSELVQQLAKRQIMYKKMYSNNSINSFTLTEVYDVTKPLQDQESDINQYIILMNEQLKQTMIEDKQAEYDLQQAEEQFRKEQEEQQILLLEQQQEFATEEAENNLQEYQIQSQRINNFLENNNQSNFPYKKKRQKQNNDYFVKTEQNEQQIKLLIKDSQQKTKMRNQYQQTSVSIDCTQCYNDLLQRMNPDQIMKQEDIKQNSIMQVSKSKYFQLKPQSIGQILTQQNISRLQSARYKRTTNINYSVKQEKIGKSLIFKAERAQIFVTPKSHSVNQRTIKK